MTKVPDDTLENFISKRQAERQKTTNNTVAEQLNHKLHLSIEDPTLPEVNGRLMPGLALATCSEYQGTPLADCLNRLTKTDVWEIMEDLKVRAPEAVDYVVVFKTRSDGKKWVLQTWRENTLDALDKGIIRNIRGDTYVGQTFIDYCDLLKDKLIS